MQFLSLETHFPISRSEYFYGRLDNAGCTVPKVPDSSALGHNVHGRELAVRESVRLIARRRTRTPTFRSVDSCADIRTGSDQSVTSAAFLSAVHVRPESQKVIRPGGSQRGSQQAMVWPTGLLGADRPLMAEHIPSWRGSCERYALSPVVAGGRWWLLSLSRLLSAAHGSCPVTARTLQGMARVRSGQAPAWPLSSDRSVRRGSRVKRDFACTFTRHFSPVLVVLRLQSCLRLEGRTRTLSGPSPDLSPARYSYTLHIPVPCIRSAGHGSGGCM
jgi:hypothetical protein